MGCLQAERTSKSTHPSPCTSRTCSVQGQLSNKPDRLNLTASQPQPLPTQGAQGQALQVGGEAEAEGLWQAVCSLAYPWLRPLCPFFPNVPPYAPFPLWGCRIRRLLIICALISLPGASWSGGAYQGSAPVRWAFRSPWVRGKSTAGAPAAGPGGCLTIHGPSHPLTTAPSHPAPAGCLLYHIRIQNIA